MTRVEEEQVEHGVALDSAGRPAYRAVRVGGPGGVVCDAHLYAVPVPLGHPRAGTGAELARLTGLRGVPFQPVPQP